MPPLSKCSCPADMTLGPDKRRIVDLSPHESTASVPARTNDYNTIILRTGQQQLAPRRFRHSKRKRGWKVGEIGCGCCSKGCSVCRKMCDSYSIRGYLSTKSTHGTFFVGISVNTSGLTNPFTLLMQLTKQYLQEQQTGKYELARPDR